MRTITGFSSSPGDLRSSWFLIPIVGKSLPECWCQDLATTSISIPSASASTRWAAKGLISVIQQNDPDHYALITDIPTTVGVRTGTFFGTSLYVGVLASRLEPAQIWNYQVPE